MKFLIGLLIGIAIAGGVAYYLNKAPNPFVDKGNPSDTNNPNVQINTSSAPIMLAPGTKMQPALPNQNSQNNSNKPAASSTSYDFYDVLQGRKEINEKRTASSVAPATKGFLVQVGAFSNQDLANNLKARMALLGYSSKISASEEEDKIINKVVMGPFMDINEAQNLVDQLKQQDINATIINLNP